MTGPVTNQDPAGRGWDAGGLTAGPAGASTRAAVMLRALVATGVLLSAAEHLDLFDYGGGRKFPTVGVLFLMNFAAGLVLGFLVQVWHHWIVVFLCAGFALTTVVFFYISVIWGLFGVKESLGGVAEIFAQIAEWVVVFAGAALLYLQLTGRDRRA